MKPLLTYYGGKQRIAKDILSLMPKSDVYIEPFCGGAAVFFARDWTSKLEVLNDIDSIGQKVLIPRTSEHGANFDKHTHTHTHHLTPTPVSLE